MTHGEIGTKPAGGFRFITPLQLAGCWTAYRSKAVRGFSYFDFRVYLALHEVQERRDAASRTARGRAKGKSRYELIRLIDEVHGLVGGTGGRRIRSSFRRLKMSGLVTFGRTRIEFASSLDALSAELRPHAERMHERIPNRKRRVPVSRGTLRFIAGGAAASVSGVMLGQILRCVYLRGTSYRCEGSCSTRFIEDTFGIHARTVKRVRGPNGVLQRMGWLVPKVADRWHVQRHGSRMVVSPTWRLQAVVDNSTRNQTACRGMTPRIVAGDTESPPPESNRYLPSGLRNQYPAGGGRDGVWKSELSSGEQVMRLYRVAVARGVLRDSEAARLGFFGAAERANRRASRNVAGFLWAIVRRGLWHFITADEEDAARRTLRELDLGRTRAASKGRESVLGEWRGSPRVLSLVADVAAKRGVSSPPTKIFCTTSRTTIPGPYALQRLKIDPGWPQPDSSQVIVEA